MGPAVGVVAEGCARGTLAAVFDDKNTEGAVQDCLIDAAEGLIGGMACFTCGLGADSSRA